MSPWRGILHVHSRYSYDGEHSLEEIASFAGRRGYSFVCMSEHSDTLDEEKVARFVEECGRVSNSGCLIIPGIEFTCQNRLHLMGLGVRGYISSRDPLQVTDFIHSQGGIAVICHPIRYQYLIPHDLSRVVDGIEVWNGVYDGRLVPNDRSLRLIREVRRYNKSCLAFGGQDLHRLHERDSVEITVDCDRLAEDALVRALKNGDFFIQNPYFKLSPLTPEPWPKLATITLARRFYLLAKMARDRMQKGASG
jgi:hypothetical protein